VNPHGKIGCSAVNRGSLPAQYSIISKRSDGIRSWKTLKGGKTKRLYFTGGSGMPIRMFMQSVKGWAEFASQPFGIVAANIQAAAPGRTIGGEYAENRVTSGFHRVGREFGIAASFLRFRQKMKHRSVMPNIKSAEVREFCDVSDHPTNPVSVGTESVL
jgi:hypothetical protein